MSRSIILLAILIFYPSNITLVSRADCYDIAFTTVENGIGSYYRLDIETGEITLRNEPAYIPNSAVSPDQTQIAYFSESEAQPYDTLIVMNVDGSNIRQISSVIQPHLELAWTPDNRYLAFGDSNKLFLVNVETNTITSMLMIKN